MYWAYTTMTTVGYGDISSVTIAEKVGAAALGLPNPPSSLPLAPMHRPLLLPLLRPSWVHLVLASRRRRPRQRLPCITPRCGPSL
jgi:hypothetical protein